MERCSSGLRGTPGKRVYDKIVSRVRIPISPQENPGPRGPGFFFRQNSSSLYASYASSGRVWSTESFRSAAVGRYFYCPTAAPQEMYSLRSMVSLNLSQAVLSLYSRPRPVEGIFTVQRPQFCGIFAAVGILKIPSATLSRENHGRRRPFYISTGRAYDINMDFPLMPKMSHYLPYPLPFLIPV